MKNTNKLTKAQQQMLDNYQMAKYSGLYQVYNSYSNKKQKAYNDIIEEMTASKGYNFRICTHNQNVFTCAYCVDTDNGTQLVYHTPTKKHIFNI